jgi:N-acetylmuramoyl-L-alanine amidase
VVDLQQRLQHAGFASADARGVFGEATEQVLRDFQRSRGLRVDGVCDPSTWAAVVESGYALGDRLLYRRSPMMRGDDVASLQQRLSALGFDPGRVDGIFGDQTRSALEDFQRNAGLVVDGCCGRVTVGELKRLTVRQGGGDPVSPLRERLAVAGRDGSSPALAGRHIAVGEPGGFAAGVTSISRALREAGCSVLELHHPDQSHHAAAANRADVDVVLFFELDAASTACSTAYYRGYRYESPTSRRLAERLEATVPAALDLAPGGSHGMALPILRETRMPAVVVRLGAPVLVVQRPAVLAHQIVVALGEWLSSSWD